VGGTVAAAVARRPAADLASRARMLSLPASRLGEAATGGPAARAGVVARRLADRPAAGGAPLVVDLSALWAGPLCARLLGGAGARVVKVESVARPDGARRGPAAFYDRLHAGHRSVALDLGGPDGRAALRRLVAAADVVIEASRPRALAQFGVDAEEAVRVGGVRAWVSITGYGRAHDGVAFGDDAAVAGGLVAWGADGRPRFVADAVADPLAGLAAAGAARAALRAGGGWLLNVSMAHVAAEAAAACGPPGTPWPPGAPGEATPPPTPPPAPPAASLGADTAAVLAELAASGERAEGPDPAGPGGRDERAERSERATP
jgi:crotonobetainyl-CoA:carnitine CoA-transferase CaiB-like acyl-CoA transferase